MNSNDNRNRLISAILTNNKAFLQHVVSNQPPKKLRVTSHTVRQAVYYLSEHPDVMPLHGQGAISISDYKTIHAAFILTSSKGEGEAALPTVAMETRKQMLRVLRFINHDYQTLIKD